MGMGGRLLVDLFVDKKSIFRESPNFCWILDHKFWVSQTMGSKLGSNMSDWLDGIKLI